MKERLFIKKAHEHVKLKEFVRKAFGSAKCSEIELQYTPLGMRILIHTATPGLVIGAGGEKIREVVEQLTAMGIENPQIDVQRIENPDIDPHIIAQAIASAIERGVGIRRLGKWYVDRALAAGAIGCEIVVSGKLAGDRSRKQRFTAGYLKKCGEPAEQDVVKGFVVALPKAGAIGVSVAIMLKHTDKKIQVSKPSEQSELAEACVSKHEVRSEPAEAS